MAIKKVIASILICCIYSTLWTMDGSGSGIFFMDEFEIDESDRDELLKQNIAVEKEEIFCHAGGELEDKEAEAYEEVIRYRFPYSKETITPEQADALYKLYKMNS